MLFYSRSSFILRWRCDTLDFTSVPQKRKEKMRNHKTAEYGINTFANDKVDCSYVCIRRVPGTCMHYSLRTYITADSSQAWANA